MLTQARLKELLHYDPETGIFTWIKASRPGFVNKPAGFISTSHGIPKYLKISIDGKRYLAHRLAFFYMTGRFPDEFLDHIDGDGFNNKFPNLRECNKVQNRANVARSSANKSGYKNVSWSKAANKWWVVFKNHGKSLSFGYFDNIDEAADVARQARIQLHGEFARHD